jgi:transcriptional regulator with PAS, ATPase and Fis domain
MLSTQSHTSALTLIRKLNEDIPCHLKKGEECVDTLAFLNRELSFASFALARATLTGELPPDQYVASKGFPVFDPKALEQAVEQKQSLLEPLNQVFLVPCIFENQLMGVLFAYHRNQRWNASEQFMVELAATEIGRILAHNQPGLNIHPQLKSKSKGSRAAHREEAPTIIGESEKLKQLLNMIDKVAPTHASVLILGESGTGKELVARRIHALSERKDAAFVAINCGALTETLLESELFGHEKGAFTGAVQTKRGLAEIANGGTLFLDEVGELAPSLQAKLLRFLQEGEFFRVGGQDPIRVSVRVLSATNRDLETEVRGGRFREDLFYRLNTISLKSPALRDRKDDLPVLMEYFSQGISALISTEAMQVLKSYPWPGNIRELQNTVERLRILTSGNRIEVLDLPLNIRSHERSKLDHHFVGAPPTEMSLDHLERIHILRCLDHHDGNKTRAAQSLGITIKTLYNKLHRYGILDKPESTL